MKCVRAVGIAVARPGKASSADGISSFLRNENMRRLPDWCRKYKRCAAATHGRGDHVSNPSPLWGRVGWGVEKLCANVDAFARPRDPTPTPPHKGEGNSGFHLPVLHFI